MAKRGSKKGSVSRLVKYTIKAQVNALSRYNRVAVLECGHAIVAGYASIRDVMQCTQCKK